MPANHGVGFDYNEDSLPSRPELAEGDPEDAIEWRDPGFRLLLVVCGELLAKSQFDDRLLIVASEEGRSTTDNEHQEVE